MSYIYQKAEWPQFKWNEKKVAELLLKINAAQGYLLGKMEAIGFDFQNEAVLNILIEDVLKSNEIEGVIFDKEQVRSSVARRMGFELGGGIHVDRDVDGIVEMMLDATQKCSKKITKNRLLNWHDSIFPTGRDGMRKIIVGKYRDDKKGLMEVVSGAIGRERVHYRAPDAKVLELEMKRFINWINSENNNDVIGSAIIHLWFVTIHPFDDGNGRIARALSDMMLARSEGSSQRFYSMSAQIRKERNDYYNILEATQKGSLDITNWLVWFLGCLLRAIEESEVTLASIYSKNLFWQKSSHSLFNERQIKIINMIFDGFFGNLTSSKWAKICKCSQDTASRDINGLIEKGVLIKAGGGRSTHYVLNDCGE
jgi:Fic family protein